MIKKLLVISGYCFLVACGSNATRPLTSADVLNFATKAQITDKTNDTTNNVSIDVFLKRNEAIRLEVTALLGYQVGSLLMTRTNLQYAIHPQKYYIYGPLAGRTLKPLFKQEIDPVIMWSLIHGENLKSRGFECRKSPILSEICKNQMATVEIEQRGDLGPDGLSMDGQKKVTIENDRVKFIWIFKSRQVLSGSQNETFVLARPKEYKLLTIK